MYLHPTNVSLYIALNKMFNIFLVFGDPFELSVMDSKNGGSQQIVL